LLYSIREGVLGVDSADRVTFANDGARDLLDLPERCVGRRTDELALSPAVVDVLQGRVAGTDVVVLHRDRHWWSTGAPPAPAGRRARAAASRSAP
jgi:two-component system, CitB family, sensor kinase